MLEIAGLWCLAVAQPLLELVGRAAPFLLHHRVDGRDLALWLGVVILGVPLVLWLGVRMAGALGSEAVAGRLRALILAVLTVSFGLGVLRRLGDPVPPWLLVLLSASGVWLVADLVGRSRLLRQFFALLSLAVPLVGGLFWVSPAARAARLAADRQPDRLPVEGFHGQAGPTPTEPRGGSPDEASYETASYETASSETGSSEMGVPIVLVIFDELPLLSMLDADLDVDADLCPHFAELSRDATWYRNARTVSAWTDTSIASVLLGAEADPEVPPTRSGHPRNLLTWLAPTHEVRAFEPLTAMAPPEAAELERPVPRPVRQRRLGFDSAVIIVHQLVPPSLAGWAPTIAHRWGDFWTARRVRGGGASGTEARQTSAWAFALTDVRARRFDDFLGSIEPGPRPGLFFAHVMLPHMPYRYLPSGAVYGGRPVYGRPATAWSENEWFALETYQRHMLQVGFVDRLVGRLRSRLEKTGLWDHSLVIVTADHGASHWPGAERRDPGRSEHPADMLQVPLFVKTPEQTRGGVDDREAWTVDIVPTVTAVLDRPLAWSVAGRSLLGEPAGVRAFAPDARSLERKLRLFDPADGTMRLVRLGPFRDLIGKRLDQLSSLASAGTRPANARCSAEIDQRPVLEGLDPASPYSPALLTGELSCEQSPPDGAFVLAALNGRVGGSGALQPASSRSGLFAVMAAPSLLLEGANRVELVLAWGPPEAPRLARVD